MIKGIIKILQKYPLSLVVLVAITYLSFFKPPTFSFNSIKHLDKIIHLVMYGGFCSVLWFEYFLTHAESNIKKVILWIVVAPLVFSAVVEFAQSYFTNYRGGEFADFIFNSIGVVFAALFSHYVTKPVMEKYNLRGKRKI
jgi:VanZ family protein